MTNLGPIQPLGSSAGGGPDGDDPRNQKVLEDTFSSGGPTNDRAENAIELKEVEGLSLSRIVFRRFIRHKAAMISIVVLLAIVVLSFSSIGLNIGPIQTGGWWHWNYSSVPNLVNATRPTISWTGLGDHPFGQDEIGHDIFARVMRGTQQSLMIVFVCGIVSTVVGTLIGAIAGYFGGRIDALLMRFTDLMIIVPLLLFAAILAKNPIFAGGGSVVLAIVLGLLSWTSLARLVRGEVLALREREFVEAAKVAGASNTRIIFRHILPNTVGVIIVTATLVMSATILTEAALSFLGLGVHPPDVSLGLLIGQYETAFTTRPWLFWFPAGFIVIIALTINFIGDGLRDAFDPRQKRLLNRAARRARADARPVPNAS